MSYTDVNQIPIGKVAQYGRWIVSRWGVDEYDVQPMSIDKGKIFKDGMGLNPHSRTAITREQVIAHCV